jgi:hypothetical protein
MQHSDVLEIRAQINGDADRPAGRCIDREQRLHVIMITDTHAQELALGDDLRRTVTLDGGDDAVHDATLAAVEKNEALERAPMFVADP